MSLACYLDRPSSHASLRGGFEEKARVATSKISIPGVLLALQNVRLPPWAQLCLTFLYIRLFGSATKE